MNKSIMSICNHCRKSFHYNDLLPGQSIFQDGKINHILLCNVCLISEHYQPGKVIIPFEAGEDKNGRINSLVISNLEKGVHILEKILHQSIRVFSTIAKR